MEPSKKGSSTKSGGNYRKIKQSPTSQSPSTQRSQNTTAVSTQYNASTSRASHTNISTHTQSGVSITDASNIYQTSGGFLSRVGADQAPVDLLGLASQTFQGYEVEETHRASFIDSVDDMRFCECPYHRPILMSDNVDEVEGDLDPMARWLAEGNAEQPVVLHLPCGQLSIHKDCKCSDMQQPGMEMEIDEQCTLSPSQTLSIKADSLNHVSERV